MTQWAVDVFAPWLALFEAGAGVPADCGRQVFAGLQPPDEPWRRLGERVHRRETVCEAGGVRVVHRLAENGDIELREVKLHGMNLPLG